MNAPQKILIVEDDVALAHAISINLKVRNHGSLVSKLDLLHAVWEKTTTGKPQLPAGVLVPTAAETGGRPQKPTALHHLAKRWLPIRAVEAFRRDRAR